jgi:L-2-amino-thiazoline-4-carboxylic acid hydrolase
MNPDSAFYTPDPSVETDYIIEGFLHALGELAPGACADIDAVRQRTVELGREHAGFAKDKSSIYNLRYACAVLAAYEALMPRTSAQEAIGTLRVAFTRSGESVREKTRLGLDQSDDPFRELVNISKKRESIQFGSGFEFQRERDDDEAYLLNIRKCFWYDFFVQIGCCELTTVLCEFDRNWFAVIQPERHGFRFERNTTLGYGGTHCPFHFVRVRRA